MMKLSVSTRGASELTWRQWILDRLDELRDKVIIIDATSERKWTGAQVREAIARYGAALIKVLGVQPGDVCCICHPNCDIVMLVAFGVLMAGGAVCSLFPKDPYPEMLYLARKTEPKFLFCRSINQSWGKRLNQDLNLQIKTVVMDNEMPMEDSDLVHIDAILNFRDDPSRPAKIPADVGNEDDAVAFISLSSGTTGKPKAIPITHANCLRVNKGFVTSESDKMIPCVASLDYASSRLTILGTIGIGYTTVLINGFDVENYLQMVEKYRLSVIFLGAASFHSLIVSDKVDNYDISSVETVFPMGAKVLSIQSLSAFLKKHPHIKYCVQGYGSSELSGVAMKRMTTDEYLRDYKNCGPVLPGIHLKVKHPETGILLGPNEKGILHVKSEAMSRGYYDATVKYSAVYQEGQANGHAKEDTFWKFYRPPGTYDEDGFFDSGDIGMINDKGELFVDGRMKEIMVCRGGKKVLPQELEDIIQGHPLVSEATVIGIPNKEIVGVDCPRAYVALNKRTDDPKQQQVWANEILDYTHAMIGWEKQLTGGIAIVDDVPRLHSSGKVNKQYLRQNACKMPLFRDQSGQSMQISSA